MQHVFISYQHEEQDFTENLIGRLEKAGFQTWSDYKIAAGEEWRTAIDLAIKNAFALIVVMTPEAKASEYITYEWAFAWGIGIKVIPVMLRPTQLHPRLEALQYLDFTSKNRPWDKLVEELNAAAHAPLAHTISIPLNSPPYIRQAVIALDSANQDDRAGAIATLAYTKHPEATKILIEALDHPITDVRLGAVIRLGNIKDPSAVPALVKLLNDDDRDVQLEVVRSLENIKDPLAVPALVKSLTNFDRNLRLEVIRTLENIEDPSAVPALITLLNDNDTTIRLLAARSLGNIKDPSAVPALNKLLKDTDRDVRIEAANTLKLFE